MTALIRFGSCMAPNADPFLQDILKWLEHVSGYRFRLEGGRWMGREAGLDRGDLGLGWICGLPYVLKVDRPDPTLRLLAAPVMAGERYQGRPVYYSDVVVRADSHYRSFEDLRGTAWGYNEPRSHSGYNIVRYEVARRGLAQPFFREMHATGSHERALEFLLAAAIDAAAIDSTVLETELRRRPGLMDRIRCLETFGPSPIPPFVAARSLAPEAFTAIQRCLLAMHDSEAGRQALAAHGVQRFARIDDRFYDPIREMYHIAASTLL